MPLIISKNASKSLIMLTPFYTFYNKHKLIIKILQNVVYIGLFLFFSLSLKFLS